MRCTASGIDDVDFRLAPNRDSVPMPLDEGPSGGELGRLALALSAVVTEEDAPVLVLDEVDTGIGGETAARVGDVLARIGRGRQVIAITHRPEIAARAIGHLTITQARPSGRTSGERRGSDRRRSGARDRTPDVGPDDGGRLDPRRRAPRRGSERRSGHPRRPYHVAMQREEAGAASITVDAPGFHGSLEELVARANRGDVDLTELSVSTVVEEARSALEAPERQGDLRAVADALALLARLVALKAAAVLPDQDTTAIEPEDDQSTDAGRRLAEYRLFKAAAEALLAEAATEGARSFLGLVSTEVIPVERLRIAPERLAAAFRAVLERLSDTEPLPVTITFSVEDKVRLLRDRLMLGPLEFEEVFAGVSSRLEAVACFLALLEMLKRGEATVEQRDAFGPITVTGRG